MKSRRLAVEAAYPLAVCKEERERKAALSRICLWRRMARMEINLQLENIRPKFSSFFSASSKKKKKKNEKKKKDFN